MSPRLSILLFAVGCAACDREFSPQSTTYTCTVDGLTVETATPILAERVQANVALARELLGKHLGMGDAQISALFAETVLHIDARPCLNDDAEQTGHCLMGRAYFMSPDIYSNVTSYGWFHELFHRLDDRTLGSIVSHWHWTWDEKRNAAQAEWDERYSRTFTIKNSATWAACGGPPKPVNPFR